MLRYFTSILLMVLALTSFAQESEDEDARPVVKDTAHQLRLGVDVSKVFFNQFQSSEQQSIAYELELDYYWRKDVYWVLDAGIGNGSLSYNDLSYKSDNIFFKAGINKSLLPRLKSNDWDMAFIGLRYGVGLINRGDAAYTITDSTWGTSSGTIAGTNLTAHWVEITGGVRVELVNQLFIGWNVRGKFMLNPKQFIELPPYYIAGYGKGEKNTAFDFNVYISYAIRWAKKEKAGK